MILFSPTSRCTAPTLMCEGQLYGDRRHACFGRPRFSEDVSTRGAKRLNPLELRY